jgi:hypothetical protein
MPALQGYETQTILFYGDVEVDILHEPGQDHTLWAPAQQVARLSGFGRRATGEYSTSDIAGGISEKYVRRVPDPHKIYTKTRMRSTTLFAVEGLIQKAFHMRVGGYIEFCRNLIRYVLPRYIPFAAHHAELIMAWDEAIDHWTATRRRMPESTFLAAVKARDARLERDVTPVLILGTAAVTKVLSSWAKPTLLDIPVDDAARVMTFHVAQLSTAQDRAEWRAGRHPAEPRLLPRLAMMAPDGELQLADGIPIAAGQKPVEASAPPPEPELPVEQPLVGVPDIFMDKYPCPTFGTYEDPEWVGLYVTDALGIAQPHQALSRVPADEKGLRVVDTPGGPQSHVTLKEPGLYRLISTSRKKDAEGFRRWVYHDVLPSIRKYGHYKAPGAKTGLTDEELRAAFRAIILEELPATLEPIVLKAVKAHGAPPGELAELIATMTGAVARLADIAVSNREQLELSRQTIQLILPSHQMFATAKEYVEMDGVADALKRAPKLTDKSFGLDHCPDYGKASLWMKRLCRAENVKVVKNTVARLEAEEKGIEVPPLYIPVFRMKRLEREHVKVLMFNPACWVLLKRTFLPPDTPTLLFPVPKIKQG